MVTRAIGNELLQFIKMGELMRKRVTEGREREREERRERGERERRMRKNISEREVNVAKANIKSNKLSHFSLLTSFFLTLLLVCFNRTTEAFCSP